MKMAWVILPLCVGGLSFVAWSAQESSAKPAPAQPAPVQQEPAQHAQWRQRLSIPDLDERLKSFEALRLELPRQPELRDMLERFEQEGGELGWTSKLLLREPQPSPWRMRARAGFEELEQRMQELERNLGDLDRMFGGMRRPDWLDFDFEFDTQAVPPPLPRSQTQAPQSQTRSDSESMRMQVTPDGVEIEVRTNKDGREEVKQYKGRSLEELREQHPELRNRLSPLPTPPDRVLPPARSRESDAPRAQTLRTDVLGVYSQKLDPDQSKALGLPPEQGLSIERVEPGTIAQVIGLMRGDTLVAINSQPIYAVDDVRRILQERAGDQELVIEIIAAGSGDPQAGRRTLRWTPREPQAPQSPREPQAPVQPKPLKKV